MQYIQTDNELVTVDFPCYIEGGKTYAFVETKWSFKEHHLKVYYRHERTWDDHMGNTPCGYYCNVPMPDGRKRRVYLYV